jgi:hypothetical protein
MERKSHFSCASALVMTAVAFGLAGCGSKQAEIRLASVTGVVTLDGQPVEGALVQFNPAAGQLVPDKNEPGGGGSFGLTDASGKYTLKFDTKREGAVIGVHSVSVARPPRNDEEALKPDPIPAKYNLQSKLSAEVKEGDNVHNLELSSKKK